MDRLPPLSWPPRSFPLGAHGRRCPASVSRRSRHGRAPAWPCAPLPGAPPRSLSFSASAHLPTEAHLSPLQPERSRCSLDYTLRTAMQSSESLSVSARALGAKGSSWRGARLPAGALPGALSGLGPQGLRNPSALLLLGPPGRCSGLPSGVFPGPWVPGSLGRSPRAHLERSPPTAPSPPGGHAPAGLTPPPHALAHWKPVINRTLVPAPSASLPSSRTPPAGLDSTGAGR